MDTLVVLDFEFSTAGAFWESGKCQMAFPVDPLVLKVAVLKCILSGRPNILDRRTRYHRVHEFGLKLSLVWYMLLPARRNKLGNIFV